MKVNFIFPLRTFLGIPALVLCGFFVGASPVSAREPSALEQYYLELVNRARANPAGEVTRLSGEIWGDDGFPVAANLNEGLAPGTISNAVKPPLAFDTRLIDSASDYSDLLLRNEVFNHTFSGTPTTRMTAAGYVFVPTWGSGENLALTTSTAPNPINLEQVAEHHMNLFIDGNVAGRGHRVSILNATFREVGVAIRADSDAQSFFGSPFISDVLSTQNFAHSQGRVFVTGVIFFDTNVNSFYDPGETAGILPLEVRNGGGAAVGSGTSFGSGGYSINLFGVAAGNYTLVARNGSGEEDSVAFSWNGSTNVKADLINPGFTLPPIAGVGYQPDGQIGTTPSGRIGNDMYSASGAGEPIKATMKSKGLVTWYACFENDGDSNDSIGISGTGSNRLFRVSYLRKSGGVLVNATGELMTGSSLNLQSGQESEYVIQIKPQKRALGRRQNFSLFLRGASLNDGSKVDRVNGLLLNRTRKP